MGNVKAPPTWLTPTISNRIMNGLEDASLAANPISARAAPRTSEAAVACLHQLGFNDRDIAALNGFAVAVRTQRRA